MIATRLSARDRRALRLGAWLLAPALVWMLGGRPYLATLNEASARLAAERNLLGRELEVLAEVGQYPQALERGAEQLMKLAPRFFGGETSGIASAALARYVQSGARLSRVLLTRLEPGPADPVADGIIALPLHVQGETDLEGLLTLLHSLESEAKLVRIAELRIQDASRGGNDLDGIEVLSFEFMVTGFQLQEVGQLGTQVSRSAGIE